MLLLLLACRHDADTNKETAPEVDTEDTGVTDTDTGEVLDSDSGETGETGETAETGETGETAEPDPPPFSCVEPVASPGLTPYTNDLGDTFVVVRLQSAAFEELYATVFIPPLGTTAWAEGAPLVAAVVNNMHFDNDWDTNPESSFTGETGVVEVQAIYPGWSVQGNLTSGNPDNGGLISQDAVREVLRWSTGEELSYDGWTVADVAGQSVCNGSIVLMGSSGGGLTATRALATSEAPVVDKVAGLLLYEVPNLPEFVALEGGSAPLDDDIVTDADADGFTWDDFRNLDLDYGDCDILDCNMDYTGLSWDPTARLSVIYPDFFGSSLVGVLYLDRNADGVLTLGTNGTPDLDENGGLDLTEDFIIPGYWEMEGDYEARRVYFSPQTRMAAEGLFEEDSMVADLPSTLAFWSDREMMAPLEDVLKQAPHYFQASISVSEVDHGVALPGRPHVVTLYEAIRRAGVRVQLNALDEDTRCASLDSLLFDWTEPPPASTPIIEGDLTPWVYPEPLPRAMARRAAAYGLFSSLWKSAETCVE